jgi:hypothetical protein
VTAFTALRQVARAGRAELRPVWEALGVRRPSVARLHTAAPSRLACLEEADRRLALFGWPQASAYRVYSAGDSSCGREEILFVARHGTPFTARLGPVMAAGRRIEWLDVEEGW